MLRLQRLWECDKPKLSQYIEKLKPNRVLLVFWHGLGDLVMFLNPFEALTKQFPDVIFDLAVQKGLGFQEVTADLTDTCVRLIDGSFFNDLPESMYDIIADIDFPMSEGQIELTKGEYCCVHELGIDPVNGHKKLTQGKNRLVGFHFQITCLPDSANVPYDVAKKVWQETKEAGYIPIETLMKHVFHNPVNERYDFIDRHIRDIPPKVSTLLGIIQNCSYFICCVSGNFHAALSILPPERICLLERDFKAECFTKLPIKRINIKEYQDGSITEWLLKK